MIGMNNDDICLQELPQQRYTDAPIECSGQNSENLQAPIPVIVSNSRSSFCCPEESENESVEAYAKQKQPGCKKSARPIRSHNGCYKRPKSMISSKAKKLNILLRILLLE